MSMEHLSDQQIARIEALKAAQPLVRTSTGPFGSTTPPELNDLVDLAVFILEGKHPMDDHYARIARGSGSDQGRRGHLQDRADLVSLWGVFRVVARASVWRMGDGRLHLPHHAQ